MFHWEFLLVGFLGWRALFKRYELLEKISQKYQRPCEMYGIIDHSNIVLSLKVPSFKERVLTIVEYIFILILLMFMLPSSKNKTITEERGVVLTLYCASLIPSELIYMRITIKVILLLPG